MAEHTTSRRTVLRGLGAGLGAGALLTGRAGARDRGFKWELARVRSSTARYNDPANAYADDYLAFDEQMNPVALGDVTDDAEAVCGMGYHFVNMSLIGPADPENPPVLAYGEDDEGNLILGAVEWIVPDIVPGDPDLFEHDGGAEEWADGPGPGVHSLHAWVHTHNPDGVLHHTNPRKQFHPDGCEHH